MRQGDPLVTFDARGRLGNVLFQTAACIGYAKKYNVPWGIPRNTKQVPDFAEMFPGLPVCEANFRNHQEHPDDSFCHVHNCNRGKCWFNYHDIPFFPQGIRLAGFWQSWKYFENAEEEVKKAFRLKHYPEMEGYVSIHVRRGDYVNYSNSFPPVTTDYIDKAIDRLKQELVLPAKGIMVFSDDIEWCKTYLGSNAECAESNPEKPLENLAMMASCSHNIIANSTYSWWAAYLNPNPDKIVISPSHKRGNWFGLDSGVQTDCIDLISPSWHQIEFR